MEQCRSEDWDQEQKNYIQFFIIKTKNVEKNVFSLSCPHPMLLFIPSRIPGKRTLTVAKAQRTLKITFTVSVCEGIFEKEKDFLPTSCS